jgi:hypothetical protein
MNVIISGIYPFFNIWDYTYPIEGIPVIIRNYVYMYMLGVIIGIHIHILMLLGVEYGL